MNWVVVVLAIIFSSFAFAQSPSIDDKTFEVAQLKEDLAFWRNRLETKHPLLYLYRSKSEVDYFFDSLDASITTPMTELAFFKHISPLTSFVQDGHNTLFPSRPSMKEMMESRLLLPFDLEYVDGRLYVIRNMADFIELQEGDEILAINGVSAREIHLALLNLVPKEGNNDQLANAAVNDLFRFYYHIEYGFREEHYLSIRTTDGLLNTFLVKGKNLRAIRAARTTHYPKALPELPRGVYFSKLKDGKSALLTISTFDQETLNQSKQRFRREIRSIFRQLKKSDTENLLLDLRDNAGGNPDFVKVLLKHLFDHRFEQSREFRIVTDPSAEEFYTRTKKKWYPWFGIGKFSPAHNHFDGRLIVLQDGNTFSAGVAVLSVLRKYNRATFVGTESGGNPIIMGGYIVKTRWELPHTKLQFSSATHCSILDDLDKNTGRGNMPDVVVEPALLHSFSEYDTCMEVALELVQTPD